MSKKIVSIALALFAAAALLAGCSGKKEDAKGTETAPGGGLTAVGTMEPMPPATFPAEPSPGTGDGTDAPPSEPENKISPALWKVSDGAHTLYLFGTIHVGDERNREALAAVRDVFDGCDALAVEVDMRAFERDINAAVEILAPFYYSDGTTVRDHLPEDLYERSLEIIKSGGEYSRLIENYNLAMWSTFLENALIAPTGLDSESGIDLMLLDRAYESGKEILEVESAAFQYGLINSFSEELYVILIKEAVEAADEYDDQVSEMYEVWLAGDTDAIEESTFAEEEADTDEYTEEQIAMFEDYDRKMLDDRNVGMADKAEEYLGSGKTVFFAVGAAHMAGDPGLVKLLEDRGYKVTRLEPPYLMTKDS